MNFHKILALALCTIALYSSSMHANAYTAEDIKTCLKITAPGAIAAFSTSVALSAYCKPEIISSRKSFMSFIKNPFYLPLKQRLIIAPFVGLACGLAIKASASHFLTPKK